MWRAVQAWLGKRVRLVREVNTLVETHRKTTGFISASSPRPRQRWSALGVNEGKTDALKDLSSSADRLDALMNHVGWKDVLEAKAFYQSLADRQAKNVSVEDRQRFQAACEWAAMEGFFMELQSRVRRGQRAKEALAKLVGKG